MSSDTRSVTKVAKQQDITGGREYESLRWPMQPNPTHDSTSSSCVCTLSATPL